MFVNTNSEYADCQIRKLLNRCSPDVRITNSGSGTPVTLQPGQAGYITQALGGSMVLPKALAATPGAQLPIRFSADAFSENTGALSLDMLAERERRLNDARQFMPQRAKTPEEELAAIQARAGIFEKLNPMDPRIEKYNAALDQRMAQLQNNQPNNERMAWLRFALGAIGKYSPRPNDFNEYIQFKNNSGNSSGLSTGSVQISVRTPFGNVGEDCPYVSFIVLR